MTRLLAATRLSRTMNSIRYFLWSLVAAMTLQGYFKADEYGSAASMIGGMSLTLSVWREALGESLRSFVGAEPQFVGLPRAFVMAGIAARRPGFTGTSAPQLRRALHAVGQSRAAFTDAHVEWMLRHTMILGGLQSDPAGRALWTSWDTTVKNAVVAVAPVFTKQCGLINKGLAPDVCKQRALQLAAVEEVVAKAKRGQQAWRSVLGLRSDVTMHTWWDATQEEDSLPRDVPAFYTNLTLLHDVTARSDARIGFLLGRIRELVVGISDPWLRALAESLLMGDLWTACLEHVMARENRIRELVVATGIQEMFQTHDRVLNASLRVATTGAERELVTQWFGEAANHAWWLSDDVPAIVRRCLGHEGGDCRRIGPTEIATLTNQADQAASILQDWTRRVFIGMWNALPAVGLLFLVEFAVLCVGIRGYRVREKKSLAALTM
jgi:hypothetical protein